MKYYDDISNGQYYCLVDKHIYKSVAEVPDYGSIEIFEDEPSGKFNFHLYSVDLSKLPKVDEIMAGAYALVIDTGSTYFYHKISKTWYEWVK